VLSPFDDFAILSASGDSMQIQTPADLGFTIRDRRKQMGLAQQTLADRVGVSRQWIVEVEAGKSRAEIGLILRTLRELGIRLDAKSESPAGSSKRSSQMAPNLDQIVERFRGKRS
jgi:HTH-type transcriptional regulator/antitoxin HipB